MFQGLRRKARQGPTDLIPAADGQQQGDGTTEAGGVEADEEIAPPSWYVARPASRRDCPVCGLVQLSYTYCSWDSVSKGSLYPAGGKHTHHLNWSRLPQKVLSLDHFR